jgi:hypothetical protein
MAGRSSLERLSTKPNGEVSGGRLLFTDEVRREFFHDRKSLWWVRRNVAPEKKIRLGHSTCAWHEEDVRAWLENLKGK